MKTMLITGAAGFIGNAACAYYKDRYHVIGIDNFSRPTAMRPNVPCIQGDAVADVGPISGVDIVLHLAAQVSVTDSVLDPLADFRNNAELTLRLAQWAVSTKVSKFIYASTNKVYGDLVGACMPILDNQWLNPKTPYGISKACGGLYVRELLPNRAYDFRQSCIYGENQVGTIDQGWVGFLASQIKRHGPASIDCFGDGTQVRDLLHISDLLKAYDMAIEGALTPGSYTVGGGEENAVTFSEVVKTLGGKIVSYGDWRPSDQRYFVAASNHLRGLGWKPLVSAKDGLSRISNRREY